MKLVADEGIDAAIVEALRRDGHHVIYVGELAPGIGDETVLELAVEQSAVLLTGDKDFGELVFRQRLTSSGVMLIRLAGLSADAKAILVVSTIRAHAARLVESFCVLRPENVRFRSLRS